MQAEEGAPGAPPEAGGAPPAGGESHKPPVVQVTSSLVT